MDTSIMRMTGQETEVHYLVPRKKRLSVVAPSSVRPDNTREGRELRQTIPQDKGREFHSRLSKEFSARLASVSFAHSVETPPEIQSNQTDLLRAILRASTLKTCDCITHIPFVRCRPDLMR